MAISEEYKLVIGVIGLICLTLLQCYAWATGNDGAVTGLLGGVIGLIIGYYFKGAIINKSNGN